MDEVKEMGEAPLGPLLLKFSLPAIAVMVVNGLYNFIDRIFIGQGMGTDALAAVTAGFPMMIIAAAVGMLFSVGTSTLISIAVGAGKRDEAASILGQGFAAAVVTGIVTVACGWIFMDASLRAFGTTDRIMGMAREYLGIVMVGFVFQLPTMTVTNSLRSQNRPRTAAATTASGAVMNAILAPIFIFVFKWGIAGAAWATVISQAFAAGLTLYFIQDRKSLLKVEVRHLAPKAKTIRPMMKLGIPVALVQILSLAMLVVANNAMSRLGGETALAVIGIVNSLSMLLMFPVMGIVQGAQALWGYNYGARRFDRVRKLTFITLFWTSALSVVFSAVLELFTRPLIAAFNSSDAALIELGSHGIAIFMLAFFTVGIQFTASQYFMSIGQAAKGGLLYLARNVLLIAGMAVMPLLMGIEGVFWSGPVSDVLITALSAVMLATAMRKLKGSSASEDVPGAAAPSFGSIESEAV
jgi:putative MATE family efflux protein